jgi:hypothetical protein
LTLIILCCRIGEKFLDWTDEDPPLDTILESVTLYWVTETLPRALYPYRQVSLSMHFSLLCPLFFSLLALHAWQYWSA